MVLPSAGITLLAAGHQTPASDGDTAGMEGGKPYGGPIEILTTGTKVVGYLGHVLLVEGTVDVPRETGAVCRGNGRPHVLPVPAAPEAVPVVPIKLRVPVPDVKVSAHAGSKLCPYLDQLLGGEPNPEIDRLVIRDAFGGIAVVGAQGGEDFRVPDGDGANWGDPSVKGDEYHQHDDLDDAHDDDEPGGEGGEGLHFVLDESTLSLEFGALLLLAWSELDWIRGRAKPVSSHGAPATHLRSGRIGI